MPIDNALPQNRAKVKLRRRTDCEVSRQAVQNALLTLLGVSGSRHRQVVTYRPEKADSAGKAQRIGISAKKIDTLSFASRYLEEGLTGFCLRSGFQELRCCAEVSAGEDFGRSAAKVREQMEGW